MLLFIINDGTVLSLLLLLMLLSTWFGNFL